MSQWATLACDIAGRNGEVGIERVVMRIGCGIDFWF
jgi:hypothetical protein